MYNDDKKKVRIAQDNKNWKSSDSNCLVFHLNDPLPDSIEYINTIKIKSPFIWITPASPNNVMTEIAKTQATKLHANVIKVTDYGGLNYSFTVKLYHLKKSLWTEYKNKRDSIDSANEAGNKQFCIIHIRSNSWIERPLFYNDSLIGKFYATTNNTMSSSIHTLDFKLTCEGRLATYRYRKSQHRKQPVGLWLKTGNEYYLSLANYGESIIIVSKDDYY